MVLHGESITDQASPRTPTQRTFQPQEAVQPQRNQSRHGVRGVHRRYLLACLYCVYVKVILPTKKSISAVTITVTEGYGRIRIRIRAKVVCCHCVQYIVLAGQMYNNFRQLVSVVRFALLLAVVLCWVDRSFDFLVLLGLLCLLRVKNNSFCC